MVKKQWNVVWSDDAKRHLRKAFDNTLERSQSKTIANKVKNGLLRSTRELKLNPFVYELDRFRAVNKENFRAFEKYSYRITYHIVEETRTVQIVRLRHARKEPLEY